jgi:hypothetical protein
MRHRLDAWWVTFGSYDSLEPKLRGAGHSSSLVREIRASCDFELLRILLTFAATLDPWPGEADRLCGWAPKCCYCRSWWLC